MNLNKNNILKNIDYNNNENTKENYQFIIDSKNVLKIENTKNVDENLGKYFGTQIDPSEEDLINQSTSSSMTVSIGNANNENSIQKLLFIFNEKLFPKCNLDSFLISKKIAIKYFKKFNENKDKIEECINFIGKYKETFKNSGFINFDLKIIHNLGYILLNSFNKLYISEYNKV